MNFLIKKQGTFYLRNLWNSNKQKHFNFLVGFVVCSIGLAGSTFCGIAIPNDEEYENVVEAETLAEDLLVHNPCLIFEHTENSSVTEKSFG